MGFRLGWGNSRFIEDSVSIVYLLVDTHQIEHVYSGSEYTKHCDHSYTNFGAILGTQVFL